MKEKLTLKQENYTQEYVENGGNGTKAALKAYDTDDYGTANQISIENLQKPIINRRVEELLQKHGATVERAVEAISDDGIYTFGKEEERSRQPRMGGTGMLDMGRRYR